MQDFSIVEPLEEGSYSFVSSLGEGSYGSVLLCRERSPDAGPGRLVAVKGFKWAHSDKLGLRLALREIRLLRSLEHPLIISLERAFRSRSGRIYAVFPYVEGGCGQQLLRCKFPSGLPPETLKLFAWQLCVAVRYLHTEKVLHRDIKPANVLLAPDGTIRLCDFGFARSCRTGAVGCAAVEAGEDRLTSYVQTRAYRAPEVLLGQPYSAPADIWSIGATIAEMATGQPLLPGSSSLDQLWRVLAALPGPRPAAIAAAVDALLRLDPAQVDGCVTAEQLRPRQLPGRPLHETLAKAEPRTREFIGACLRLEPSERATADQLLQLPWFDDVRLAMEGKPALLRLYYAEAMAAATAAPPSALSPRDSLHGGDALASPLHADGSKRALPLANGAAGGAMSPSTPPAPRQLHRAESDLPTRGSLTPSVVRQAAKPVIQDAQTAATAATVATPSARMDAHGGVPWAGQLAAASNRQAAARSAFAQASLPFEEDEAPEPSLAPPLRQPRLAIAPPSPVQEYEIPTPQQPAGRYALRRSSSTATSGLLACVQSSGPLTAVDEPQGPRPHRHHAAGPYGHATAAARRPSLPSASAHGAGSGLRRVTTYGTLNDPNLLLRRGPGAHAPPAAGGGRHSGAGYGAGPGAPRPLPLRVSLQQRGLRSAASHPCQLPPASELLPPEEVADAAEAAPGSCLEVGRFGASGPLPPSPRPSGYGMADVDFLAEMPTPKGLPLSPAPTPGRSRRAPPPHVRVRPDRREGAAATLQDLLRRDELIDEDEDSGGSGADDDGSGDEDVYGNKLSGRRRRRGGRWRRRSTQPGRGTMLGYVTAGDASGATVLSTLPLSPVARAHVAPAAAAAVAAAAAAVCEAPKVHPEAVPGRPPQRATSLGLLRPAVGARANPHRSSPRDIVPAGAARTTHVERVNVAPAATALACTSGPLAPTPSLPCPLGAGQQPARGRDACAWRAADSTADGGEPRLSRGTPPAVAVTALYDRYGTSSTVYGSTYTASLSTYGNTACGPTTGCGYAADGLAGGGGCGGGTCRSGHGMRAGDGALASCDPLGSPRGSSDSRMESAWADFSLSLRSTPQLKGGAARCGEGRSADGGAERHRLAERLACAVKRFVSCGGAGAGVK